MSEENTTDRIRHHLACALAMIPTDVTEEMLLEKCTPERIARTLGGVHDEVIEAFQLVGGTDDDIKAVANEVREWRLLPGRRYPWPERHRRS